VLEMSIIIVLAMHGAPPGDFPKNKLHELMELHAQMEHTPHGNITEMEQRFNELDSEIRSWPRTPDNDPFFAGAQDMAAQLRSACGYEVIVGYNEFCAPRIDEAVDQAVGLGADRIIVVTPMMTRGGEHAEKEILEDIERCRKKHPDSNICYAWPFEPSEVARFLAAQVNKFV
jgi:sirohydrochlorin cobaltochelatase